ncbi:MAG: divalent metal cation transporter, partial [Acidobacteriota bacterium]|nr:divalent metal cation transporter [Acidobacteriota bacterium]
FLGIFSTLIVVGALVALIPGIPQIKLLLFTQTINGLLLPIILIAIVSLASNREIMGDYKNSFLFNCLAWTITIVVSSLSLLLIGTTVIDFF